ncbi:hypothetical protein TL16_g02004 [Triparma laevis f. inornata]|uniref:Uncharacterized protein n=2 Tax=Triparma laevis TaxID=1534972 RepID=A0A9W6ZLM0_9STRA|nr:hypothetical protein TrLO_g2681 [Triparma laevis f. longispina]GMH55841.1 hypothetical protein TL16_g02004 [Triparma laevis f. inornata]
MLRPFLLCHFPSEEIARSVARSTVLIKHIYKVNSVGGTEEDCVKNSKPFGQSGCTWKVIFDTFASKFPKSSQSTIMHKFIDLHKPPGQVLMKDPTLTMAIIHEYPVGISGAPLYPKHNHKGKPIPENINRPPLSVYFCSLFAQGGRDRVEKYTLKKRTYLGPTSMDNELSLIMCNAGLVKSNSYVFDPFVGTGSILFSASVLGGICVGTDIDTRVLKGKGEGGVMRNFEDSGLPLPEIVRADNSLHSRVFKGEEGFDAIVTDPPYGIRAGARKSGTTKERQKPIPDEHRHDHIPQTQIYPVGDVMADLLTVSARQLKVEGRLVYLIPSLKDFEETDLPTHPCLELEWVCYQPLGLLLGRRMVVMKKVREWKGEKEEEWKNQCWPNGKESADKVEKLREQMALAAAKEREEGEKQGWGAKKQKTKKQRKKEMRNEVEIKKFEDEDNDGNKP